jgi:hypothetical protein
MIAIRDIYQWFHRESLNYSMNYNLSPLEQLEYHEKNKHILSEFNRETANRSFVGENLIGQGIITNITLGVLNVECAYIDFDPSKVSYDYYKDETAKTGYLRKCNLIIKYQILFDEQLYEKIRKIFYNSMVEFEGEILSIGTFWKINEVGDWYNTKVRSTGIDDFTIKLNLSDIRVVEKKYLYTYLLNDNFTKDTIFEDRIKGIAGFLICTLFISIGGWMWIPAIVSFGFGFWYLSMKN